MEIQFIVLYTRKLGIIIYISKGKKGKVVPMLN
jgi:hypothetical protein